MNYSLHDLQFNGLRIYQCDDFFKFGTDAISLVNFANAKKKDTVLDIGSGSGIIPIMLAGKFGVQKVFGVEIQESLCIMANKSVELNDLATQIKIINMPAQQIKLNFPSGFATLVTANPPYSKVGSGELSSTQSVAMSRFEQELSLKETIEAAKYSLSSGGRFCMVHRVERLAEVITECTNAKLQPKRLKLILPKLFLLECKKDGKVGLRIEQPI